MKGNEIFFEIFYCQIRYCSSFVTQAMLIDDLILLKTSNCMLFVYFVSLMSSDVLFDTMLLCLLSMLFWRSDRCCVCCRCCSDRICVFALLFCVCVFLISIFFHFLIIYLECWDISNIQILTEYTRHICTRSPEMLDPKILNTRYTFQYSSCPEILDPKEFK
jgi:hypothetical protein